MDIPTKSFLTHSLRENPWGHKVARILAASLAAVEPGNLVRGVMHRDKNLLHIGDLLLDLEQFKRVILIGIGKGSAPMSTAAAKILGDDLTSGIILTKKIPPKSPRLKQKVQIIVGGHPVPDQGSVKGAQEILKLTENLTKKDLVLVLLSGGGSSLLTAPAPGISLEDLQLTNQVLLSSGADIRHINTIRKHISRVKGGQLAKQIHPARLVTLILSDVMDDRYHVDDPAIMVASGPTLPDPTTIQEAVDLISYYKIKDQIPASVINHLVTDKHGNQRETPKSGDKIFDRATALIIGNNQDAVEAGIKQAEGEGFASRNMGTCITGEASRVGKFMAAVLSGSEGSLQNESILSDPLQLPRPACVVSGGESTVIIESDKTTGKGGRNLELALSAMPDIDGVKDVALITLATDGEDGTTGAAGAVVTGESHQRALDFGLDPYHELANHNSYHIFEKLSDLIITGPTFTNVNDLCFLFLF